MKSNLMTLHKKNYFPSQWEFLVNKKKARLSLFCGGMGSGKTFSLLNKVFISMISKKNGDGVSNGLVLYPTYSLAEEVFIEPFKEMLDRNGVGYTYNTVRDAFIAPQPYFSWTLDEDTCCWEAPVAYPDDGERYTWNEATTNWVEIT